MRTRVLFLSRKEVSADLQAWQIMMWRKVLLGSLSEEALLS